MPPRSLATMPSWAGRDSCGTRSASSALHCAVAVVRRSQNNLAHQKFAVAASRASPQAGKVVGKEG